MPNSSINVLSVELVIAIVRSLSLQLYIISGYTGMMLTVDGWLFTVNSQQWTRIYYSDANGFDITSGILSPLGVDESLFAVSTAELGFGIAHIKKSRGAIDRISTNIQNKVRIAHPTN